TTTLQRHLFNNHSQIVYLGKPYPDSNFKEMLHKLIMQETMVFQAGELKSYLAENVAPKVAGTDKLVMVSDEMLVSYSKARDKGLVAQRLIEIFKPSGVVFTIRRQEDILKAAYLSRGRLLLNVPKRYSGLHVPFNEWLESAFENTERSYLGHIDYYKTIDYYARLLGKENVCVLLLEEFVNDRESYIGKLCQFLGIAKEEAHALVKEKHANRPIGSMQLQAEAREARWFPLSRNFPGDDLLRIYNKIQKTIKKDREVDIFIEEEHKAELRKLFSQNNRALVERFDLPLEKYNYML
ncbi:MAG: hypothetical protein GY765_41585, partial [bacterium]|nr:hypothetical protein [bacterium]